MDMRVHQQLKRVPLRWWRVWIIRSGVSVSGMAMLMLQVLTKMRVVMLLVVVVLMMVLAVTVAAVGLWSWRGRQAVRPVLVARRVRRMRKSSSAVVAVVRMPLLVRLHDRPRPGLRRCSRAHQRPLD